MEEQEIEWGIGGRETAEKKNLATCHRCLLGVKGCC